MRFFNLFVLYPVVNFFLLFPAIGTAFRWGEMMLSIVSLLSFGENEIAVTLNTSNGHIHSVILTAFFKILFFDAVL